MENIQNKSIEELVSLVIRGEFGNGLERENKLGDLYQIVQNKVIGWYLRLKKNWKFYSPI